MDFSKFEYDFKSTLTNLTIDIQKEFEVRLQEIITEKEPATQKDLIELMLKIVDLRYVDSLNICTSVLKDYHKNLTKYLEDNL